MADPRTTPLSIKQDGPDRLRVEWQDGHSSLYAVRELRLHCRCAHCIEEFSGRPLLSPEKVPEDIKPVNISPVGRYAIQFAWSDGHDSGIYTFENLRADCPCCQE